MGIQDFRNSNKALVYFSYTMSVMPLQACLLRKMLTFKYFNLDDVAMMSKLTWLELLEHPTKTFG
jgi:hypothetical protein